MKIADMVADDLRSGANLSQVRTKYRSVSQVYTGLQTFLDEADKLVEDRQTKIRRTMEELAEKQTELECVKAEKENLSKETETLRVEKEQLSSEARALSQLGNKKDRLQGEIGEMRKQGYTPELLKKIGSVEPRNGAEFWFDLQSVSRCRQLAGEVDVLTQRKTGLKIDVEALEKEKKEK